MERKVVLITGCSSGIGRALAEQFHRRGHLVYATSRKVQALQPLAELGMPVLPLDVTDRASIDAAIATIRAQQGRLDILVNNAGYGQFGAAIDLDPDTLRRQFETNVFAPLELTRAALPLMLPQKRGCVANVGSVSGIMTTPFAGAYCASKAALHALSDAMRMELAPFGIKVVMVQPGAVKSRLGESGASAVALPQDSLYASIAGAIRGRAEASQQNPTPADAFASTVASAVLRDDPPATLRSGRQSFLLPFMRRWLPLKTADRILSRKFGLNAL
jgi:NAD(P)-dependent dehydrogenase (short-subunit alcohol dehydrogenase family)